MAPPLSDKNGSMDSLKNGLCPKIMWLWIVAFGCALFPIGNSQLEMFTGAVLCMFVWSCITLSRKLHTGWDIPKSPVLLFGGLFWILVIASVAWSEVKSVGIMGACFFSVFPLTFFTFVLTGNKAVFTKIAYVLAGILAVMALWAVVQFFFLNAYFMGQARHPLADPSSLGALFSLGFFCSMGWALMDRPSREHKIAIALSTLLLCGMMSTVARGPFFAAIPALILFSILLWPRIKARKKSLMVILLGGLAFYGLMQTGLQKKLDLGDRLFGTITLSMSDVSNNRLNIWSSAVDIAKDHPWMGTGIGTFFLYYPEYRKPTDISGTFLVHNDPLQFWVELGVLGPLLFYAFVIAAAIRSFSALKNSESKNVPERIVIVSIFCALMAIVVHSHVSFNHYNLSSLMLMGFLAAVWFLVSGKFVKETQTHTVLPANIPRGAGSVLMAMPFVMMGWMFVSIMAGEYFVSRARDNLFGEQMFEFANNINAAGRVSQGMNSRAYLLAVNVPMAILESNNPKLDSDKQKKLYEQVKGYMDIVISRNPRDASARYYLGKVQTIVDSGVVPDGTMSPEEYFREALRLDPMHIGSRMEIYKIMQKDGRGAADQLAILEPGMYFVYTTPVAGDYYRALAESFLINKNYVKAKEVMQIMYDYKKRSDFSQIRQNTSLPQAIMGGDQIFQGTQ